jgi:beta-glucosidase
MSDWFATRSTVPAANGSLDLAMPGPVSPWGSALVDAVERGEVPEARIDEKVGNILRLAARVGALEGAAVVSEPEPWPEDVSAELMRRAAATGFVLLRNENDALPLALAQLRSVAVIGPNAVVGRTLGGGSALVFPPYTVQPLDGLRAALPADVELLHAEGTRTNARLTPAPVQQLRLLDQDESGVELRFRDADGELLGREHRRSSIYTWLGSIGDGLPINRIGAIEVLGRLRAERDGEHQLGCSALGRVVLVIDGQVAFDRVLALPEDADPVEALVRPPQAAVAVELQAGQEISFRLRLEPTFVLPGTALQLNLESPRTTATEELDAAVELAARAEVAVVVVGTTEEVESEGFDRTH